MKVKLKKALDAFKTWMAVSPLGSAFKSGVALVIAAVYTDYKTDGVVDMSQWQTWLGIIVGSCIVPIINWWNDKDTRSGRGSA